MLQLRYQDKGFHGSSFPWGQKHDMIERVKGMSFLDLASNRYSERYFDPRPVEREKIDKILAAGRTSPTACRNRIRKSGEHSI